MKKTISLLLALVFVASIAFAQEAAVLTLKGTIIDNQCAGTKDAQQLSEFVKTHTKECALACAPSGYAIISNGVLVKFDKESNVKVEEFLKKADSKLDVVVEAKKAGEEVTLISIKNQE
jgi:phosphoribosylamine-glycine ligase